MDRRRKFWGWGFEDQQPPDDEVAAAAAGAREHLGFAPAEVERPARLEDIELRASADRAARLARAHLRHRPLRARHALVRKGVPRHRPRASGAASTTRPTWSRGPADEADVERVLAWCEEAGAAAIPFGGGTSVVGGVEPPPDRPGGVDRPGRARPGARGGRGLARGADPGRRARAGARGPAPRARPHAPPLPAVVRVLDARRLDRHPRGRPLRDALHPHRRPRGVGARGDAARRLGEPPTARLGRRPEPRPDADRLRGHPRGDHRGMDAGPGRADLPRVGRRDLRLVRVRRRGRARAVTVRPPPVELPPAGRRRGRPDRRAAARRATAGPPCWSSASNRPTTNWRPG